MPRSSRFNDSIDNLKRDVLVSSAKFAGEVSTAAAVGVASVKGQLLSPLGIENSLSDVVIAAPSAVLTAKLVNTLFKLHQRNTRYNSILRNTLFATTASHMVLDHVQNNLSSLQSLLLAPVSMVFCYGLSNTLSNKRHSKTYKYLGRPNTDGLYTFSDQIVDDLTTKYKITGIDDRRLRFVFKDLIANAFDAGTMAGRLEFVSVSVLHIDNNLVVRIRDNGLGYPKNRPLKQTGSTKAEFEQQTGKTLFGKVGGGLNACAGTLSDLEVRKNWLLPGSTAKFTLGLA
ncbi:MAG: ATP-binding protein [bacterium]